MKTTIGAFALTIASTEAVKQYGGASSYGYGASSGYENAYGGSPYAAPSTSYAKKRLAKYQPAQEVYATTFAACGLEWKDEDDQGADNKTNIAMIQQPKYAIMVKAQFTSGLAADTEYQLNVHTWGNVSNVCNNIGALYNPLVDFNATVKPVWNGWEYAMPSPDYYGEIIPFKTDGTGQATLSQNAFLQNLEGYQTLIGRAIVLTKKHDPAPIACCVIGRDVYHAPGTQNSPSSSGYNPNASSGSGYAYNNGFMR